MSLGARSIRAVAASLATGGALILGLGPAGADRETGGTTPVACASTAFDAQTLAAPLALGPVPATVLTTVLSHPCPGPVYVEAVVPAILDPTPADGAQIIIGPRITCAGDGCEVTGTPIDPGSLSIGGDAQDAALPARVMQATVSVVFPDLPAGTYIVDIVAFGEHAQALGGQLQARGGGTAAGAGRLGP